VAKHDWATWAYYTRSSIVGRRVCEPTALVRRHITYGVLRAALTATWLFDASRCSAVQQPEYLPPPGRWRATVKRPNANGGRSTKSKFTIALSRAKLIGAIGFSHNPYEMLERDVVCRILPPVGPRVNDRRRLRRDLLRAMMTRSSSSFARRFVSSNAARTLLD